MLKRPRRLAAAFLMLCLSWFLMVPAASLYAAPDQNGATPTPTTTQPATTTTPGTGTTPTTQTPNTSTTTAPVNDGTAADGSAKIQGTCRQGGILSYLVCPLINAGVETINKLTGLVEDMLKVRPLVQDDSLYNAWKVFRDFSNALFVLVFFAIIVSTALSVDLNAYSLRTMLPRLIAAVLLVQASFFVTAIIVDIGNVLGAGIGGIFNSLGNGAAPPVTTQNLPGLSTGQVAAVLSGLTASLGAIVAGVVVGWPVILMMLATAVLSVLGVFVTLAARQLIIAVFIIISPLAFVAMVLPNTKHYFTTWHKNLTRAILLYPLIITILSVGGILTQAARDTTGAFGSSDVANILASLIPIVAFMSVPVTFKLASNIMSTVSGAFNRHTNGLAGRFRNGQLLKDARAGYQERGAEAMRDAPTALGRARGALASGNAFRFGSTGARAKAASFAHAFNQQVSDQENVLDNMNFGNADLMHLAMAGNRIKIGDKWIQARDSRGRLIVDREGNRLKDKFGNDVALTTNKAMKTAAIKQIAAGGGLLELGQIHDAIFNRHDGRKGAYRENEVLGESLVENTEIWFRGIGAAGKMGDVIKSLPQTNPGKLVSAFDTLTADQIANIHQRAAIPYLERILDDREVVGGADAMRVRAQAALQNLAQVADNQNLRTKIDAKVLFAFKMNADKFQNMNVKINGQTLSGDQLIHRIINDQGKMNALDKNVGSMAYDASIDSDALDNELKEWAQANFDSEVLVRKTIEDPEHYEP